MIFYFAMCFGALTYFDIRDKILPDALVLLVALSGFCYGFHAAAALPLAVYFACALIAALLKRDMPFGMGDAKLLSAIALSFGFEGLAITYVLAALTSGACAAFLLLIKRQNKKDRIAFGPFIAISFMLYFASTSAM